MEIDRYKAPFMATALILALAGGSQAGELFTPPLFITNPDNIRCEIVNLGVHFQTATIQIRDINGDAVGLPRKQNLGPGQVTTKAELAGSAYCHFTVEGSGKDFRASACVASSTSGECVGAAIAAE